MTKADKQIVNDNTIFVLPGGVRVYFPTPSMVLGSGVLHSPGKERLTVARFVRTALITRSHQYREYFTGAKSFLLVYNIDYTEAVLGMRSDIENMQANVVDETLQLITMEWWREKGLIQ